MNLSRLSIKRPVFAWMIMAFLLIFGTLAYMRTGVSLLPDVDFPIVNISLSLNGAAPEVMENQVVDLIEDAVMQIDGIRSVSSNSKQTSANISIEFEVNKSIDLAVQEVQSRIYAIKKNLPENLDPPSIRKMNPEDQPIIWIVLSGSNGVESKELMDYAKNKLANQFAMVSGVADVILGGYVDPSLRIYPDIDKLNKFEMTVADLIKSLQNEHVEFPLGKIEKVDREIPVRILGQAMSVEEFKNLPLQFRGQKSNYKKIMLKDVARVEDGTLDIRRMARFNGKVALGIGILKQHGSNAVEVSKRVRARLDEVQKKLPENYQLTLRMDSTKNISESVDEMLFTMLLSIVFTSVVCYLFLGSFSSTINVFLAIPTSIIGTFIGIYFFGFTLNTFTILGLSLAIGLVVDDAIMMLENIMRYFEMGHNRVKASLLGSEEITFAAIAATIAIVAIFLPVVFMKGVIGKYFFQYGITVTFAVLLSLLEALTLTPMRSSHFLEKSKDNRFTIMLNNFFARLMNLYAKILTKALNYKYLTLVFAFAIFGASLALIKKIPTEMLPAQDTSMFLLRIKAPVGASLPFTQEKFLLIENYLNQMKEVSGLYASIGGFGGDQVNEGVIMVSLVEKDKRKLSQKDIMNKIRDEFKGKIKGVQVIPQDTSLRGFSSSRGFPIEFSIVGPDFKVLRKLAENFMDDLNKSNIVTDLNSDIRKGLKEFHLIPNREKAALFGVNIKSIAQTLNAMISGVNLGGNYKFNNNGQRYDIFIRLLKEDRETIEEVKKIKVRNNRGELISIHQLIDIREEDALQTITRLNRERAIGVFGNIVKGQSQNDALKFIQDKASKEFPSGYKIVLSGSAQSFKESFKSLFFALLLGILVSYMVLASQFNSLLHPVSILIALPFSITGALMGLFIFSQSINIFSFIGIILLMGIAKKNSILLVEFTNQQRKNFTSVTSAILYACPIRLRPILMTSTAAIAGALPAAISLGPGAETRVPMAIAIIGGIIVSTCFTLLVVPCLYAVLIKWERKEITSYQSIE